MVNHRFVSECTDGRVDAPVYRAYLEQEFAFLETAAVALGHAVVDAPSFAEVRRFADVLHGLVTDQRQYFERAFASDCAPHWGPIEFVEWSGYPALWASLVHWLAGGR